MTKPLARVLAGRLKGKPLLTEHEDELGSVGEIVHSWIDEATNSWHIQAVIDTNTLSGLDALKTILSQREDGTHVLGEVSLSHQGDSPIEVSAVEKGARDDCTIDDVQIVTAEQLKEIKNQCYKISPDEIPVHLPAGAPVVRASFASRKMTTTYTAIQKAPPATSYVEPQNFGLLGQQQQAAAAAGQQKTAAEAELQALKDKMEKLEQLLGTKLGQDNGPAAVRASAATPPQEQQQQQQHQQQQQTAPMQDTQPNLEEQGGIQALAALLSGPNILSNSQRGQAHNAVLQASTLSHKRASKGVTTCFSAAWHTAPRHLGAGAC